MLRGCCPRCRAKKPYCIARLGRRSAEEPIGSWCVGRPKPWSSRRCRRLGPWHPRFHGAARDLISCPARRQPVLACYSGTGKSNSWPLASPTAQKLRGAAAVGSHGRERGFVQLLPLLSPFRAPCVGSEEMHPSNLALHRKRVMILGGVW